MDTLTSLRVFCRVAELKSFTVAADRLDMSPTMASRHVRHLEDRVGTRLLNRDSRRVSITEAGELYLDRAKQTLDALDDAEAALGSAAVKPMGTLRIGAPMWFADTRFSAIIAEFAALYPEVRFDVDLSGREPNLIEEGFDLAFRAATPDSLDPGMVVRALVEMPLKLVACPAYLDRFGRPERLIDLNGRDLLVHSGTRGGGTVMFRTDQGPECVRFNAPMQSSNESLLRLLALEGLGMAMLPEPMVESDVAAGQLEWVVPGTAEVPAKLYAVLPSRRLMSAKVRTFIDFFAVKARSLFAAR